MHIIAILAKNISRRPISVFVFPHIFHTIVIAIHNMSGRPHQHKITAYTYMILGLIP